MMSHDILTPGETLRTIGLSFVGVIAFVIAVFLVAGCEATYNPPLTTWWWPWQLGKPWEGQP
jgi:hypothetical protein